MSTVQWIGWFSLLEKAYWNIYFLKTNGVRNVNRVDTKTSKKITSSRTIMSLWLNRQTKKGVFMFCSPSAPFQIRAHNTQRCKIGLGFFSKHLTFASSNLIWSWWFGHWSAGRCIVVIDLKNTWNDHLTKLIAFYNLCAAIKSQSYFCANTFRISKGIKRLDDQVEV